MTRLQVVASSLLSLLFIACSNPTGPSSSTILNDFVKALRDQGLTVSLGGQISPNINGFFSVPADQARVNDSQLNAFVYSNANAATREAVLISTDGQPSPTARVSWVSTPHFYHHDKMIVLYVGCATEIIGALQKTTGAPIAVGSTPCNLGGDVRQPYVRPLGSVVP